MQLTHLENVYIGFYLAVNQLIKGKRQDIF